MKRRTFLKMAGLGSIAFAAGCGSELDKRLFSLVTAPDDLITGQAAWYASVCRECPAGCGILVKNREGRAIKIEGNPLHPVNRGKLCLRGQAALQGAYHPDRLTKPMIRDGNGWRQMGFAEAEALLLKKLAAATARGPNPVQLVTEVVGDSLLSLFDAVLKRWGSGPPVVYEPLTYDALKTANARVFGRPGIPFYRLDEADFILSFGADFLETWVSPVAYARLFKTMHGVSKGKKGVFFHAGPHQSLTAANADLWLCCRPGFEAALALGLVRQALERGMGEHLPAEFRQALKKVAAPYSPDTIRKCCGLTDRQYARLVHSLSAARAPVFLGAGARSRDLAVDLAANLLNWIHDPRLSRIDFAQNQRVALADAAAGDGFFDGLAKRAPQVLMLNRLNPVYSLPPGLNLAGVLRESVPFAVCFAEVMDDTARAADLVFPVRHFLEGWDEYAGVGHLTGLLQPAMAPVTDAPTLGDLFLRLAFQKAPPASDYKTFLQNRLRRTGRIAGASQWVQAVRRGGVFDGVPSGPSAKISPMDHAFILNCLGRVKAVNRKHDGDGPLTFLAVPSLRFLDGRGGNRPWLCEVPDPLTKVSWQTPVLMHPETMRRRQIAHEDVVLLTAGDRQMEATVYETEGVHPSVAVMSMGQGHQGYTRYADGVGCNPLSLMPSDAPDASGSGWPITTPVSVRPAGKTAALAHTDGSRIQHGRKIALSVRLTALSSDTMAPGKTERVGLTMNDFPLTLPIPEGYAPDRDFYPPHAHDGHRWAMVVDLDRCIGCGACAVACYAENNIGIVGEARILEGREMAWLRVERYHDMADARKIIFLPMMCQHCDNAPCEAVCPVYAPHHSKEGLNNQIYNRCIGTRFCSQNCPYKVRRFNWFDWQWPEPLPRQLNPDVTVRAKGVMEKCSFCVQRIKAAHGQAKNENRFVRDGEVVPACVQTCPTDALVFGDLMDPTSRVRQLADDPRAYQVMGYLNTKPAVIYLKKVTTV